MPIRIRRETVRAKKPGFDTKYDLPDRTGMVVSGPMELFTDALANRLSLAGFKKVRSRDQNGHISWRLPASVGAPPDYLLRSLSDIVYIESDRDVQNAVKFGSEPFGGQGPGAAALSVGVLGPYFIANCDDGNKNRRGLLEGAGWFPLFSEKVKEAQKPIVQKFGTFPYVCQDGILAFNMQQWMTPEAKTVLLQRMKDEKVNVLRSDAKERIKDDPVVPMPEGEALQGFQDAGVNNLLRTRRSGVIYDDMGLGKTVQGVAYSNAREELSRILLICKANMKFGWAKALDRFGTRSHNVHIIEGASEHKFNYKKDVIGSNYPTKLIANNHKGEVPEGVTDVVIINYDILSDHEAFIRDNAWDMIILDEIHSVSNHEALRTKVLFGNITDPVNKPERVNLSKGGVIVGLSGTPHPVVERMWPILSGLRPDLFGTGPVARKIFINRYAPPTLFWKEFRKGNKVWKKVMAIPGRPIREAELNRRLRGSGFMTRRLKIDMKDFLPPKSRAALELPFMFSPDEIKELSSIDGQVENVLNDITMRTDVAGVKTNLTREGRAEAIINVVQGLHPKSPEFHEISRLRARIGEIKAPYVARYVIEETEGEDDLPADIRPKTVIFAHHKTVIASIKAELDRAYPHQTIVYDGSVTSDKKRFELETRFQTDDRIRFFLMSLSGASGITLTRANRLYMAELDWDPTNLPQIEDRIWRMTQELPCFIGYFMVPNSLDVQMGNRLIQRMEDNRKIYDKVDLKGNSQPKKTTKIDDRQGKLAI